MEGDTSPLALNAWEQGPNSYLAALEVVNHALAYEKDYPYSDDSALTSFIAKALHGRLASQTDANDTQFQRIKPRLTNKQESYIRGIEEPAELMRFLYATEGLDSIETRRRTHLGNWDVWAKVDVPFRRHLDESPQLSTQNRKSEVLYRIKDLNITDTSPQHFVQIDRKRTVRQHFGGKVLTVVRNSFVLHDIDGLMPETIRSVIEEQRASVRRSAEEGKDYNYDEHKDELRAELEPFVVTRDLAAKPVWAIPLATTYYAAMADKVKAEELKKFN